MDATEHELEQARRIKNAALAKGLKPISDLEYLQHAIISKDKVSKALKRIERMEKFREKYNIRDAESDNAISLLRRIFDVFPGAICAVGRDDDGYGVTVSRVRYFLPGKLKKEEEWQKMMVANFYFGMAFCCNVEAIRKGIIAVSDCSKMSLSNFSLRWQKENRQLFHDAFPMRITASHFLDAPTIVNSLMAIMRAVMSEKIKKLIQFGSAANFFASGIVTKQLTPSEHGGNASEDDAMQFLEEQLMLRVKNEQAFKL